MVVKLIISLCDIVYILDSIEAFKGNCFMIQEFFFFFFFSTLLKIKIK
jgi:hypothetical protein